MLSNLERFPVDWLIDEKMSLKQRIVKLNIEPIHPPVGYRYPHALVRHLEERLAEVNAELHVRAHNYPEQAADIERAFK